MNCTDPMLNITRVTFHLQLYWLNYTDPVDTKLECGPTLDFLSKRPFLILSFLYPNPISRFLLQFFISVSIRE